MKKFLEKKLVRVRCKKNYAEAHCHVNIEVIHWIGPRCDYNADFLFDGDHNLVLDDKKHTVISFARDSE